MSPRSPSPSSTKTLRGQRRPHRSFPAFALFRGDDGSLDGRGDERWCSNRKVDGVLLIPSDFSRRWHAGDGRSPDSRQRHGCQPGAHHARLRRRGRSPSGARRRPAPARRSSRPGDRCQTGCGSTRANDSHYFLVPGLIVLVMTIIGAFLTAMVVAREWERGTLEALFVTPMRAGEFLVSKIIPYFGLGMIGFVLCLLAGQFLFHVPLRGSLSLLCLASMIYLAGRLGNRAARLHLGQEPVPRQPTGDDADLSCRR